MEEKVLIEAKNLKKYFKVGANSQLHAVDGVNFKIKRGTTLGVVGESGCGKSTFLKTLNRMNDLVEGCSITGKVELDGEDIYGDMDVNLLRKRVGMVFQKPNPFPMSIYDNIAYGPRTHCIRPKAKLDEIVEKSLRDAAIWDEVKDRLKKSALGMSGGQQQRLCIARALALNPEFVVCDEPVSALDVSIQAQIINLLKELQDKYNLTYLFISHDLSVVEHISDTVGVMYLGNLVEYGATPDIFSHPLHPYTKALFSAIPIPDPTIRRERIVLQGSIPSPANPPKGCKFHTRCPYATERCKTEAPQQREVEPGHYVVCHLYEK